MLILGWLGENSLTAGINQVDISPIQDRYLCLKIVAAGKAPLTPPPLCHFALEMKVETGVKDMFICQNAINDFLTAKVCRKTISKIQVTLTLTNTYPFRYWNFIIFTRQHLHLKFTWDSTNHPRLILFLLVKCFSIVIKVWSTISRYQKSKNKDVYCILYCIGPDWLELRSLPEIFWFS